MEIATLLAPQRIVYATEVSSKKRAFEYLATLLANEAEAYSATEISATAIFDALSNREKLGSTAIGNGVAIPHACLPVKQPYAAVLLLDEGIKMDTPDKKPVCLFMAILVPSNTAVDYAELMTQLTKTLMQKTIVEQIFCYQTEPAQLWEQFRTLFTPPPDPFAGAMAA